MLVIALLAGFVGAVLIWGLFMFGTIFLAQGASRSSRHRPFNVAFGLVFVAPGVLLYYIAHESELNKAIYRLQHWRDCHRRLEVRLPATPRYGESIELISHWESGSSTQNENVLDLASHPLLYLGASNSFHIVEHRGQRYFGSENDYLVRPYDRPTADYVISLVRPGEFGASAFRLDVVERSSSRRVGSVAGYLGHDGSCPRYAMVKTALDKMIKPLPTKPDHPPVPTERVLARAARPQDEIDDRIGSIEYISGPVSECPTLEHPMVFKDTKHMIFRLEDKASRHIRPTDARGQRLRIVDIACRAGEVFALVSGEPPTKEHLYYLYRYSSNGTLLAQLQIHTSERDSLDPPGTLPQHFTLARDMKLSGDELTFQIVALHARVHGRYTQQNAIQSYTVTLPWRIDVADPDVESVE